MDAAKTWTEEACELETRLLEAAEALLAHRGTAFALVPFAGRLPPLCVAIGELSRIREMLKPVGADI